MLAHPFLYKQRGGERQHGVNLAVYMIAT